MDITTLSLNEVKALAYDQINELQRVQNNLNILNQEIVKRNEVKPEVVKEIKEKRVKEIVEK